MLVFFSRMKNPLAILLFGVLSMLFAEVFSGASTLWFITPWGVFLTLSLYLGHALFFFNVAVRTNRTSPRQLYFFGMLFGLYEALITKVLWFGYPSSTGPTVSYFFGVAWSEFLTLVLFWHPVMSFVIPVFVYELLSRDIIPSHERFLQRNWKILFVAFILVIVGAIFQSNGAKYNVLISLGSLGGTIAIILVLHRLTPKKNLSSLTLGKKGLLAVFIFLVILYGSTTVFILPERLPKSVLPYLLIFLWYLVSLGLLWIDKSVPANMTIKKEVFTIADLPIFVVLLLIATVLFSLLQSISIMVLTVLFVSLMGAGVVLFFGSFFTLIRYRISLIRLNKNVK
jgi:hypothetical protein